MKSRSKYLIVFALMSGLAACGKKETKPAVDETPKAVESSTPSIPAPAPVTSMPPAATTKLSAEQRAAKLGFVRYLPQNTEIVMAFHNGSKSVDRMKSSKLWNLIESEIGMGSDMQPMIDEEPPMQEEMENIEPALPEDDEDGASIRGDTPDFSAPMLVNIDGETPSDMIVEKDDAVLEDGEIDAATEASGPAALLGTEFTIALGKSTGEQTGNLLKMYRRMNYFQMRSLAKAFAAGAKAGDFSSMEQAMMNQYSPELLKEIVSDPESGINLLERMKMPPLYLAFKTTADGLPAAAQQIAALVSNLGMMGELTEPVETEKGGSPFSGFKISGAKISTSMEEERGKLAEMLETEDVDRLFAVIAKKDLAVLSGTLGDYVVLFIGASADDLELVTDINQSMTAVDSLAFCDAYASKDLAAVIYGQKESLDQMSTLSGGIADIAAGLRDGLSGQDGLGDTSDLESLLRMVGERETALLKLASNETLGMAAYFEEGLKIECFGGTDARALDWKSPNKLANLGASEDVVLFANMTSDAAYDEKMQDYLEVLMETAYAVSRKVTTFPLENKDLDQFKNMSTLFDEKFRTDAVALWDTFTGDFSAGIGAERALVVDLNGTVPTIPGIPQAIVNDGKFPRVTMIAPVIDRSKLSTSWDKMNATTTSILEKISEISGEKIPMQKPMSSEKNGYTTWFFSFPFINDDFVPSVTLGDKWFSASSSKNQALDLIGKAESAEASGSGLTFTMNFKALHQFSRDSLNLVMKNSEALFGANAPSAAQIAKYNKFIDAMSEMDKLSIHARRDGGVMRNSIHWKTR